MADHAANVRDILARLGVPPASQGQPPTQASALPFIPPQPSYPGAPAAPPYGASNPYGYPQPSSSGSVDLSGVTPYQSGVVPGAPGAAPLGAPGGGGAAAFQEAIAKARSYAANHGATPYERSAKYQDDSRPADAQRYQQRDRSRSPGPRRENFRDNYNPYRDERRDDRGRGAGYGRDRERSFSPRGGRQPQTGSNFSPRGRDRSPVRGGGGADGDDGSEIIYIEPSLVGLIIGRQGENLRRVENDSGCKVQFLPAASPDEKRRSCKIAGPREGRNEAKAAIYRIIDDSGMTPLNRGFDRPREGGYAGGRGGGPPVIEPKEGEECLQIMVPDRTVGLIIGRGGETIRDLQERSGCHINIVGEAKSVNGLRPVNLIGTHETAQNAKNLIMEIVDSDQRNGGPPGRPPRDAGMGGGGGGGGGGGFDRVNDSIYVPAEAVGMIIGRGGETIREMQSTTGCKINVSQSSGPNESEREIGLVGSRDAISRAKLAIEDKVEAVRQKNGGGGGPPHRGRQRDFDSPNYGQGPPANQTLQSQQQPPAVPGQPAAGAAGAIDPYAAYGGWQNYAAMWFQAMAQQPQAQSQQPPGGDGKPPGTL